MTNYIDELECPVCNEIIKDISLSNMLGEIMICRKCKSKLVFCEEETFDGEEENRYYWLEEMETTNE